jgi:hypothetical protein
MTTCKRKTDSFCFFSFNGTASGAPLIAISSCNVGAAVVNWKELSLDLPGIRELKMFGGLALGGECDEELTLAVARWWCRCPELWVG